jgi:putative sugar O-methyltransferase
MSNGFSRTASRVVRKILNVFSLTIVTNRTRDAILSIAPIFSPKFNLPETIAKPTGTIPEGAGSYLTSENPVLKEYRSRYSGHPAANHVVWNSVAVEKLVDLRYFRADNLYVYQSRRYTPHDFYANAAYAYLTDKLKLWEQFGEDDCFGAEVFEFHGKIVSRELLDSIVEINFLHAHCELISSPKPINVLEIGAGYGRLAHRLGTALPKGSRYLCTDAVPESTFISTYYLKYRQAGEQVAVIPLDEMDTLLQVKLDLMINVHSFPECRYSVIEWWLNRVREMGADSLFIVVASSLGLTSNEGDGTRRNFQPLIEELGYRLVLHQNKFEESSVLKGHGVYPSEYYLFKRA